MHRSGRWAAGSLAGGIVLVVAASASGTAAGTPSSEPSCAVVQEQSDDIAARYEAAAQRCSARAERSSGDETLLTQGELAELTALSDATVQQLLQLHAIALAPPQDFVADDVEVARWSVQQLAPRLAGV